MALKRFERSEAMGNVDGIAWYQTVDWIVMIGVVWHYTLNKSERMRFWRFWFLYVLCN